MTHDERRLLCAVARAVAGDNTTASVEIRKLIKRVQRHEHCDHAERLRRRVAEEDEAIRRGEPQTTSLKWGGR